MPPRRAVRVAVPSGVAIPRAATGARSARRGAGERVLGRGEPVCPPIPGRRPAPSPRHRRSAAARLPRLSGSSGFPPPLRFSGEGSEVVPLKTFVSGSVATVAAAVATDFPGFLRRTSLRPPNAPTREEIPRREPRRPQAVSQKQP